MSDDAQVAEQTDQTDGTDEGDDQESTKDNLSAEQLKEALTKARRQAAKYRSDLRSAEQDAKAFRELKESEKSELQKLTDRAEAAEKAHAALEQRALRAEVAAAKGVPGDLVELLTGANKAELEAKADKLLAHLKTSGKQTTLPEFANRRSGTPITGRSTDSDVDSYIRNFGR